ncbi:hypothetical protein [Salsuginibacillus kocurii]|uniref:hypothetical protein n=1 Tax=Salsuginibacillus kocurii TaxID=427078 RepID=UPI0003671A7C|nr:hypothetical protein [Salsuginibacillus kocurii]
MFQNIRKHAKKSDIFFCILAGIFAIITVPLRFDPLMTTIFVGMVLSCYLFARNIKRSIEKEEGNASKSK